MSGTPASQEKHENPSFAGENMKPVFNGICSPDENNAGFLLDKERQQRQNENIISSPPSEKCS